ncbi:SMP-30/gluconolactonase/LRE family protein [Nitratireductor soli]|uniref:SMP-30/gluconolactonase/LRE family protein n=1 Tax=Nitratireductor soli TaxID=1670619 RepID=UPI00065DFC33|nr:SMP-30/gluconolactonase/LRE family protein [Nitratireductor soli]
MSGAAEIVVLHAGADIVGESPLWDADRNAVWWVDIPGHAIHCRDFITGGVTSVETPFMPGALALDGESNVIVAGGSGWHRLIDGGAFETLADTGDASSEMRMNDGAVDPAGRFWAGSVPLKPTETPCGRLYRLDANGVFELIDGLHTQNGTAVSPDGKTFYLADSHPRVSTIWAFDFDVASGTLANRRVFHRPALGRPDGAAIDAQGCYWFAAIDAGLIVRLNPQGREMGAIGLPVSRPTNLGFCGEDLSTLVITSMAMGAEGEKLAGSLLAIKPGVKGWPQPRVTLLPVISTREAGKLKTG